MEWGSAALSRGIGYTIEELNTQGWSRLVFPEDLSIWDEQFQALLSNQATTRESRVLTKAGDVRWLRHTLRPEWDEDQGRVVRIYGVVRDVTERKQAEMSLRESEERFRTLSPSSPIGIFQTDAPGSVVYTNPMWQKIAGQTLQESLGSGWTDTIAQEDQEMTAEAWRAFVAGEREYSPEYRLVRPDGELRWIHARAMDIRSETRELLGYVGTVEDITERKQTEEQVQADLERAQRIQMGFLPKKFPLDRGLTFAARYRLSLWKDRPRPDLPRGASVSCSHTVSI
jgi:PAS domain S-box-containing protein